MQLCMRLAEAVNNICISIFINGLYMLGAKYRFGPSLDFTA